MEIDVTFEENVNSETLIEIENRYCKLTSHKMEGNTV